MYCGYCEKKVDGMHQLFTMGGFANPYGCKECYDKMKREELREGFKQYFEKTFPNPRDFENEIMCHPEPESPRYLALKWWRALEPDKKQLLSNSYMDRDSQPRRHWQSLTGREIEGIYEAQKKPQPFRNH